MSLADDYEAAGWRGLATMTLDADDFALYDMSTEISAMDDPRFTPDQKKGVLFEHDYGQGRNIYHLRLYRSNGKTWVIAHRSLRDDEERRRLAPFCPCGYCKTPASWWPSHLLYRWLACRHCLGCIALPINSEDASSHPSFNRHLKLAEAAYAKARVE